MEQETSIKSGGHTCPWWFIYAFDNPLRKLIHNPERMLSQYVNSADTVLDVGCGIGYFTIGLARLVGTQGKVIAADLQQKMLAGLRRRALRAGVMERIHLQLAAPDQIGIKEPLDFALAFWMVHEVSHPESFLSEIYSWLKPGGAFYLAEPYLHVSSQAFDRTQRLALTIGFHQVGNPKVAASRAVIFEKPAD